MERHSAVGLGRIVTVTILLSWPAGLALVILAATGRLSVGAAFAAWTLSSLATGAMVRAWLGRLDRLAQWIRSLALGGDAGPPPGRNDAALAETVASVGSLRRAWQQKSAEMADSARHNESLLANLPDPLLLLDPSRRVVRANRAAQSLLGNEVAGRDLASVLRDPALMDAIDAVLGGHEPARESECALWSPAERVFHARIERLDGHTADGAAAILTLHNLTAMKQMERMRADFVANASHELRTPLASLSGFIETLQGPARDDAEARERFLDIMAEQARRMGRLVADLLSLSRIELNEHTRPGESVDLERLLASAAAALRPLAEAKAMRIGLTVAPGLPPVTGQPDELAQLFQNLLDNAVKYGRDATEVEVSAEPSGPLPPGAGAALRAGPALMVRVRDHGEGIAREHLPRLTERFYRVDTARSRKLGGTGLGLAIVKHIVNRHRGHLGIDSTVGQGSTFTVWLPCAPAGDTGPSMPPRTAP